MHQQAQTFFDKTQSEKTKKGYVIKPQAVLKKGKVVAIVPARKTVTKKSVHEQLWDAVVVKDIHAATKALENGANPNTFRIPPVRNNNKVTFDVLKKEVDGHHNDDDMDDKKLENHHDYISVLMKAAQLHDVPMLQLLKNAGANVNLVQPILTYADGYGYGGMTALCYALHCPNTTQWFLDNGADIHVKIGGLPGYEDIPCPNFSPLLLASEITKNEDICRLLVEAGADVNYSAPRNTGGQGRDTSIVCYWRSVVASSDISWATCLLEKHDANANWPTKDIIQQTEIQWPESHVGFRATVLMTAVANRDVAMAKLLLKHDADVGVRDHVSMEYDDELEDKLLTYLMHSEEPLSERSEAIREFVVENMYDIAEHCDNRLATALSIALGNADVPDTTLVTYNEYSIMMVNSPYCDDPMIAALIEVGAVERLSTHQAAVRRLVDSDDIAGIMPTYDELKDEVAHMSAEKRATYFRVKADRLAEGMDETAAKAAAIAAAEADPEYDDDSAYGTDYSDNKNSEQDEDDTDHIVSEMALERSGGEVAVDDSIDGDMSIEYEEEEYERDADGSVVIVDVSR